MKLFGRILIGTCLCFVFSYFCAALGKLGSFEAVAARYAHDAEKSTAVTIERIFPANQVQEVEIDAINTDINFISVDSAEVKVSVQGNYPVSGKPEQALESKLEDGKLTLSVDKLNQENGSHVGLTVHQAGKMAISLPKSIKKVSVKTVSGELEIHDLSLNTFKVETVSGDIKGSNSQIDKLKIETTSGVLNWQGQIRDLDSESISGDMELDLKNTDPTIQAQSVSGDIKITFEAKPDLKLDLATTSGDLEVAPAFGKTTGEKEDYSITMGSGKGSVRAKTVSGDLKVLKK